MKSAQIIAQVLLIASQIAAGIQMLSAGMTVPTIKFFLAGTQYELDIKKAGP